MSYEIKYNIVDNDVRHGVVVIESPPIIRTVKAARKYCRISLPYQVYFIRYYHRNNREVRDYFAIGFRLEKLKEPILDQYVFGAAGISYMGLNGICLGTIRRTGKTLDELIAHTISGYWQSSFGTGFEHTAKATLRYKNYWRCFGQCRSTIRAVLPVLPHSTVLRLH